MLEIKKRNLIFIIVVALIAGSAGTGGFLYAAVIPKEAPGHQITGEQYEEYQYYKNTYGRLDEMKKMVAANFYEKVSDEDLITGIYRGLFAGTGDIFSGYYTKNEYESLMTSTIGEYSGIGVTIAPDERGYIVVIAPTQGTPADRAGIKSEDKIIKVDGKDYTGATIDAAASAMRGKAGTKVKVTILRASDGTEKTLDLRRETITEKTVYPKMLEDNIGYIRISSFEMKTGKDFEKAFHDMEVKGVSGAVIDLRDNPGGLVDSSVEIGDLLLPEATIAYTQTQDGEKYYYKSDSKSTSLPYVILINGGSASASEILACAVQDNKGGNLVGTKTFGKGIIQEVNQFADGGGDGYKLTTMQYFSPNGNVIQKQGVTPDYVVELSEEDYNEDGELINDKQLDKAIELLKK